MAQRPLVGYDHREEADESDTEEPEEHLDIDDDDDFDIKRTNSDSRSRLDDDRKKVDSSGGSSISTSQLVGELRPVGSLVSYVGEEESDEEEAEETESVTLLSEPLITVNDGISSVGSVSPKSIDSPVNEVADIKRVHSQYSVQLPPEPEGRCSRKLQSKIAMLMEKRVSLNEHVQRKKDFRNPSIYEKLVLFCSINETGTNFPKKYFNPAEWGPESYYDTLAKVQKEAHDKREKEKLKNRTQVDFVTATKKTSLPMVVTSAPAVDDKLKRSKWDKPVEPTKPSSLPNVPTSKPSTANEIPAKKPKLVS